MSNHKKYPLTLNEFEKFTKGKPRPVPITG